MSEPITIEDIYKLFQASQAEADRLFAESRAEADRRAAETARLFAESKAEADRLFAESKAEADRRAAETARLFAESKAEADRLFAESKAEADKRAAEIARIFAESKAEADRRAAEAEKSMNELRQAVKEATRSAAALTTRWGRFVEELVEPAVVTLFQSKGIDVKEVHPRIRSKRQGFAMEVDILAVDDGDVVLVECKSRLSKDDVDEFLAKLPRFKECFPAYKNYVAYGAMAGIEINEGIDRYAMNKGLFVIRPSGETVTIVNDENFKPAIW